MRRVLMRPVGWLLAGGGTIAVAVGPPLHRPAEELFAAHMVQHLLLVSVAAPLLVAGLAGPGWIALLPRGIRLDVGRTLHRAGRRLASPRTGMLAAFAAWVVHVVVLWAWHTPVLYEAALRAPALHGLEHASLLITAMAFWAAVLRGFRLRILGAVASVLYLFAAAGQSTALGALITLADQPMYSVHAETAGRWGLTPLADQQLAGAVMWVCGGLGYLGGALAILARVLRADRGQDLPVGRMA